MKCCNSYSLSLPAATVEFVSIKRCQALVCSPCAEYIQGSLNRCNSQRQVSAGCGRTICCHKFSYSRSLGNGMETALGRRGKDFGLWHTVPLTTGHLYTCTSGIIDSFFFG